MNTVEQSHYKTQLRQQREGLLAQRAMLRGGAVSRAEASAEHFTGHEDSQAQVTTAKDLEFALDAHETKELEAVEAALQRLENGSFGECTDCGAAISPARLSVAPDAARCFHCQEKAERA
jgi:DnaK suppressor protein